LGIKCASFLDIDGLGGLGSNSDKGKIFLFAISSGPALRPTWHPTQWVPGPLSSGVERPGREARHSPPSSAKVKNVGVILTLRHTSSWSGA
jgi:hypothetical protein